MRRLVPILMVAALWACGTQGLVDGPALDRFYFPAGMAHVQVPGKTNGVLLVANANGDKRYTAGSVVAVDLDALPDLPQLGASDGGVTKVYNLHLGEAQRALIGNFAGELHLTEMKADTEWRAYVPTRAEGNGLFRVRLTMDGGTPMLSCIGGKESDGQNCLPTGLSMTPDKFAKYDAGIPRAPQPYGVASAVRACTSDLDCCAAGATSTCGRTCTANACVVDADGTPFSDLWVTHISQADAPALSATNYRGYLVHVDSDSNFGPDSLTESSFVNIGYGASNSAVAMGKWVYVTGRIATTAPNLIRLVKYDSSVVYDVQAQAAVRVSDARAVQLSSDRTRLYMLGRLPDSLLIADIQGADTDAPSVLITKQVPSIDAVIDLKVIPRAGKGDLIVISGGTSLGMIAIYDVDSGQHVAVVRGVGAQPSNLAVDVRGNAARIFAGDFGDGRVAVVDIDDLDRPQDAKLVAHLGKQQVCLVLGEKSPNCRALAQEDR